MRSKVGRKKLGEMSVALRKRTLSPVRLVLEDSSKRSFMLFVLVSLQLWSSRSVDRFRVASRRLFCSKGERENIYKKSFL